MPCLAVDVLATFAWLAKIAGRSLLAARKEPFPADAAAKGAQGIGRECLAPANREVGGPSDTHGSGYPRELVPNVVISEDEGGAAQGPEGVTYPQPQWRSCPDGF